MDAPNTSALPSPAVSIATVPSHGKGMQLGSKTHARPVLEDMGWDADTGATDVANAWGDGDLIDVNADEDDWGRYLTTLPIRSPLNYIH